MLPPPPARGVGYVHRTFGSALWLGRNWHPFTFYGCQATPKQQPDGTLLFLPSANDYGAQACSCAYAPSLPYGARGTAFGGGGYFVATMSFTGAPSKQGITFWMNDIENMGPSCKGDVGPRHWPGQPPGYGNWIEVDVVEHNTGGQAYGIAMHNWFGTDPPGDVNTGPVSGSPVRVPADTDFSQPHRYGWLWVPARADSPGWCRWYFDDVPVGNLVQWDAWAATMKPPPVLGSSAFSVLDTRHLALILGTGDSANPNQVWAVEAWQASAAANWQL